MKILDNLIIITPVYNDWESFYCLVNELDSLKNVNVITIIAVDDGSTIKFDKNFKSNIPIRIIELHSNLGHQRAISVGLSYVNEQDFDFNFLIVMDCDGEDQPHDLKTLLSLVKKSNFNAVGFAKRQKRTNGIVYKLFYRVYKLLFYALTSEKLDFGNFSCMTKTVLKQVVSLPDIWNHFSGGIMKSKLNYTSVGTNKGKRYAGTSKMNFQHLVLHGLSSLAIYLEIVTIRVFFFSLTLIFMSVIGFGAIVMWGQLNQINFPAWYWLIIIGWVTLLLVIILITFFLLLTVLNQRASRKLAPKSFYKDYINSILSFNC